MNLGSLLWATLLPGWRPRRTPEAGYTLLLPVPGDLPVFARMAVDICRRQDPRGRLETFLIPDLPSAQVEAIADEAAADWPDLRYLPPPRYLRPWLRKLNDPGRYHGVQLVTGVQRSRATHVFLHDADAILMDQDFLAEHFEAAQRSGADATGVHPYWDAALREHRPDLVATWEMCATTDWLRSVRPQRHLGHVAQLEWGPQLVDTTIFAQLRSASGRLQLHGQDSEFVHFNYVISTYRKFQAGTRPYLDGDFRLLLIRALSDALSVAEVGEVPTVAELARGTTTTPGAVVYPAADEAVRDHYASFRRRLAEGVSAIYGADTAVSDRLRAACEPLDRFYSHAG